LVREKATNKSKEGKGPTLLSYTGEQSLNEECVEGTLNVHYNYSDLLIGGHSGFYIMGKAGH
jgi:hypothetical protein